MFEAEKATDSAASQPLGSTNIDHGRARRMPLTPEMRRGIDQIRDYLYGGGYPDPLRMPSSSPSCSSST